MKPVYLKLTLAIVVALLLANRLALPGISFLSSKRVSEIASKANSHYLNSESCFALGLKFELRRADLYDLELIPRLSENVAKQIIFRREAIIQEAETLPNDLQSHGLEGISGIGNTTATKILKYIELK